MNRALCKRIYEKHGQKLNPDDIQIGCACHVIHLVCQVVLSSLGLALDSDVQDLYEDARNYPLVYVPEDDEDVRLEMELSKQEAELERDGKLVDDNEQELDDENLTDESDDSDGEADVDDLEHPDEQAGTATTTGSKGKKSKKNLSPPEKAT